VKEEINKKNGFPLYFFVKMY